MYNHYLQTGVGMPQLSCILECADAAHGCGGHIISDGGITCPGDAAKAFGGWCRFCYVRIYVSRSAEQSGGELIEENGKLYKVFYGMSSRFLCSLGEHYGGVSKYRSSEGKTVKIEYKGTM